VRALIRSVATEKPMLPTLLYELRQLRAPLRQILSGVP